ncbi:lipoyl(octanoyl) transferase LipB [Motiliproteus sp. MSK22-1]|uniref:lipoyl(octanoyl) transferase LipB n=1 Tax=Motiliproteus sp. MSK22-1 TaxID=1897630 RepID=UPI001E28DC82|nr:lipoyl(octanoyl) transferase LipB [Motiliproteus sp. MSK22-1]
MGSTVMSSELIVRQLGLQPYMPILAAMQQFTDSRDSDTSDEIWLLEHEPVFTQGQAGKEEHLLAPGDIPVVKVDRGGQVTYHGPGQLIVYLLLNLKRLKIGVRELVTLMEESIVHVMKLYAVEAYPKADAPGVYVKEDKLASLGLRVRRGCSFHGLALNVDMDIAPFQRINPCGYPGLQMVQVKQLAEKATMDEISRHLLEYLTHRLGYNAVIEKQQLD